MMVSQDNFPYDNISKSMTIATSIFWKDWDKVKTNQEQRMKFLTRIEQKAKELEINGFLHNSRVQIRLILHHPMHNKSRYP